MRFALAGAALALASCGGCELLLGPEGEVARVISAQGPGATLAVPGGGVLKLRSIHYSRMLVKPEGEGYVAVATVDAEGDYEKETAVSYLGLERVPFVRRGGAWEPKSSILPALAEIAAVLAQRRSAIERRDPEALERLVARAWSDSRLSREAAVAQMRERVSAGSGTYRATRWIVRTERQEAEVLEEVERGAADGASKGQVRLQLKREDGAFRISAGLF